MAAESANSSGSVDAYIGSFIGLISKAEIRHEGFLFHLNPQESTIGLRNGRRKDGPQVLPSDKVYEYIFFQGSDIKDLQVISSPSVQSTSAVPNDPAIIQSHYPCPTSASSSFPSGSAVPATNISSNAQSGLPNSTFQGNMPLNQPVGSLGSWGSLPPPPTANDNGIAMPTYWLGQGGSSGGVSHLQRHFLLQPAQGLPVSPPMIQQMQNPTMNSSFPSDASNFTELYRPLLPTFCTGSPSLTSTVPSPSTLQSILPIKQSATLPSKLSPNLMTNNASYALPTVTLCSNSSLASLLTPSSLDVNPVVTTIMDKPKSVFDSTLPYQTISQSTGFIVGSFSPVQSEASIPSLLTPVQLLQPGPTGHSSSHLQIAQKDIEVVQASTAKSLSSDSKSAKDPAESLPSPTAKKLNGAALRSNHSSKRHAQGRENMLNGTAAHTCHSEKDHAKGKGNWLNVAALRSHHSYRGHARGRAIGLNRAALHSHQSNRGHSRGREIGTNKADVHNHRSDGGRGRGRGTQQLQRSVKGKAGLQHCRINQNVSPTITKFTEDFDFDAMNEKFNKEEIWGHLGKSNKNRLEEDNEGDENDDSANDAEEEDEDGLPKCDVKPVYVKDDFFDSFSCNTLDRGSGRGRAKFSEQMKIDIETFGEIPRQRRGHSSQGPGSDGPSRGSHCGRGYGYFGRGRIQTVWSRVT